MKNRVMLGVVLGLLATVVFMLGCNSPTAPDPVSDRQSEASAPVAAATTPAAVAPSPAATPTADAAQPYVEFNADGSGKFCNPMTHRGAVTIVYTKELDLSVIYGRKEGYTYFADPKACVQVPPAAQVLGKDIKLGCDERWEKRVQQDANNGEVALAGKHLGHVFVDVLLEGPKERETIEEVVTYTDWSECKAGSGVQQACFKTRTKIITTTKRYVCKEPVVDVQKIEEKEPCTCPCVEQWSGSFTVKADTHEDGEYAYRVCTKRTTYRGNPTNQCNPAHVVWQDWLREDTTSAPQPYPVNGDTLYVQVNLDRRDNGESNPDGAWEGIDESAQAKCGDLKETWNEDISFNCKQVCR